MLPFTLLCVMNHDDGSKGEKNYWVGPEQLAIHSFSHSLKGDEWLDL